MSTQHDRTSREGALSRREVLKIGASTGATVLLGFTVGHPAHAQTGANAPRTTFNAYIAIRDDNATVIQVPQVEMGQGIHTTFPAIVAEEMDADWAGVVTEFPAHDPAYFNPVFPQMFTGNAESTRTHWPILRNAGAMAREKLALAAARRWGVAREECRTRDSVVHHEASGRSTRYADLAAEAFDLVPPQLPSWKPAETWSLLRRSLPRRDLREKVTGAPIFGIDTVREGMIYAAIRHADTPAGTVEAVDRASVEGIRGVLDVVELPHAVAVTATSTWPALKAARALDVRFRAGPRDDYSTASLDALYEATLDGDRWTQIERHGASAEEVAPDDTVGSGNATVTADYHSAWQAHATMEPMNAFADVRDGRAYILAPTQGQTVTLARVAAALGLDEGDVVVERTFLGGGFGRRLMADYAVQAALISRAVGRPVQLVWSREEDMRHDHYRPHTRNRMTARLDAQGYPSALDQRVVSPTIISPVIAKPVVRLAYPAPDASCVEGMTSEGFLYGVPDRQVHAHILDVPVPTMVWRTTGYGPNVFAVESFVDELAVSADADPIVYRIELLRRTAESGEEEERRGHAARAVAVLELLRGEARWGRPIGAAQGVAFSHCFQTMIAQVVDVTVGEDGALDIHKVTTVLDGGYVLDPDITEANITGGVYWGLTQALTSEITFEGGRTVEANYDDFTILALPEAPPTELHWIDSGANPGGLGEVGPVPTAPALANAIAAATGRRLRTLPLSRHGIHTRYRKRFLPPREDLTRPKA